MDSLRAKELREKIERARAEEEKSLQFLRRDRHKQIEAARNNGASQDSLDALGREFDRFEAAVSAQADEMVANWQREHDELEDGEGTP